MNRERFERLAESLGVSNACEAFDALKKAYAEQLRHYHTERHIDFCLSEFDRSRDLARMPEEVEWALWFHDAVYDPRASDNEERSAQWACGLLESKEADRNRIARIKTHILATRHAIDAEDSDSQVVLDIDLAILGAEKSEYAAFERNVRKEYAWVPMPVYCQKRAEILQSFLARKYIFNKESFRQRLETKARANLSLAIENLARR